jgi:hypothetical protein
LPYWPIGSVSFREDKIKAWPWGTAYRGGRALTPIGTESINSIKIAMICFKTNIPFFDFESSENKTVIHRACKIEVRPSREIAEFVSIIVRTIGTQLKVPFKRSS